MQTLDNFDWKQVSENWDKWWDGKLGRPVIWYADNSEHTQEMASKHLALPNYKFMSHYDFSIPAIDILEAYETRILSPLRYHADSFPAWWANFGPGVLAAFIGGTATNTDDSVWFYPGRFENKDIHDIHFDKLDKDSVWFKRIEEFFKAAVELWGGKVQSGMTDLGGTLDVISTFRPGIGLLTDLYDEPDEVKRLSLEIHRVWWEAFEYFDKIICPVNHGRSGWATMLASKTFYMLQCDFAYMISPEMFEEFVKPELAMTCKRLGRPFYHLDGTGQIPHVKHLCSIPELAGIQWIPGAGLPGASEWPDLLNEIVDSGKLLQVYCVPQDALKILSFINKPEAVAFLMAPDSDKQKNDAAIGKLLARYDIN